MSPFVVTLVVRWLLIILFFPFSALDKVLNFEGAVGQAKQRAPSRALAIVLILGGLAIEIAMPLAILSGVADRLGAFILAGYCIVTAVLWKQFWRPGDFWRRGASKARELFWDFLKNLSLAGGLLLITFGLTAGGVATFVADPLSSSHPYSHTTAVP